MTKRTQVCLILFSALCLVCGLCLAFWPTWERNNNLDIQSRLAVSIEEGNGEIIILDDISVPFVQADEMDYYYEDSITEMENVLSISDAEEVQESGENIIIIGTGMLSIPKIDLLLPVIEGVRSADLKIGLGHVPDTPAIGEKGNAVIAGHRSYTYGDMLNRLDEVEMGDIVEYRGIGMDLLRFEVYEVLIVDPGDPSVFDPTAFPSITLLTCTPVRVASHRLIVRGRLIDG